MRVTGMTGVMRMSRWRAWWVLGSRMAGMGRRPITPGSSETVIDRCREHEETVRDQRRGWHSGHQVVVRASRVRDRNSVPQRSHAAPLRP